MGHRGGPPHVMQVTYSLARGGSEQLAVAIARAGVNRGLRMSVCGLHAGGDFEESLRTAGVRTHVMGRSPGLEPRVAVRMGQLFRREGVDVVITHHLGQLLYSAVGARVAGARLLHVEHEYYTLAASKAKRQLRMAGRLAERFIAVSDGVARFLIEDVGLPSSKVGIIRNGVDLSRFAPAGGRPPSVAGVSGGRPIVGSVGRLAPEKDHRTLIAAFRSVLSEVPRAALVLVGDGPVRQELEAVVAREGMNDNVCFLGDRADVAMLLSAMDVFVLSSVHEGVPLALLEAMASAKPVVVTDVGGMAGVIGHGRAGVVVRPRDVAGMAAAIAGVLREPAAAARMGEAGREIVEQQYDMARTVDAYLTLCVGPAVNANALPVSSDRER